MPLPRRPISHRKSTKSPMSCSVIASDSRRFNASSYSKTKGTEIVIENLSFGRNDTSLNDAPRRDLNAETKIFVSITIFIWYYISYRAMVFKWNIMSLQNVEVSCGPDKSQACTAFNENPRFTRRCAVAKLLSAKPGQLNWFVVPGIVNSGLSATTFFIFLPLPHGHGSLRPTF